MRPHLQIRTHAMKLRHHRGHDRATVQDIEVRTRGLVPAELAAEFKGGYQKAGPGHSRS